MTAINDWIHFIYEALNCKESVVGLFYDLGQAFDTIDHDLLLNKLYAIGVRGNGHSWVRSYLKNRKQTVVIDGVRSDSRLNETGLNTWAPTFHYIC